MNELRIFDNQEFGQIRVIDQNGDPWFVGKDLSMILGYKKIDAMYRVIDSCDKMEIDPQTVGNAGFPQNGVTPLEPNPNIKRMVLINESGLYDAIFSSKLPSAKKFKRWVTSEVLPSIRKHGEYVTPQRTEADKAKTAEAHLMNAKSRMAGMYLKIAREVETLSTEYKNILAAKAAETLAGAPVLPLPKSRQKTYSAKEIGELFDISANKVGRIANLHGLKVSEYGEYYRSKSEYSNKEVDTWVYYDSVIPVFAQILGKITA